MLSAIGLVVISLGAMTAEARWLRIDLVESEADLIGAHDPQVQL